MEELLIRPLTSNDQPWKENILKEYWGSTKMVRKDELIDVAHDEGFIAVLSGHPSGLITLREEKDALEITSLVSLIPGKGIGTKLLEQVITKAKEEGVNKIWVIITNDNMSGLKFYQKRGFILVALYPNSLEKARALKPEIPQTGLENIPMRDEIELHYFLK